MLARQRELVPADVPGQDCERLTGLEGGGAQHLILGVSLSLQRVEPRQLLGVLAGQIQRRIRSLTAWLDRHLPPVDTPVPYAVSQRHHRPGRPHLPGAPAGPRNSIKANTARFTEHDELDEGGQAG